MLENFEDDLFKLVKKSNQKKLTNLETYTKLIRHNIRKFYIIR